MSDLAEQVSVQEQSVHKQSRRKLLLWCAISLLNVGLLVLFLTQLLTPASKSGPSDPLVGHPAPDFSLALLSPQSGQSALSLSDLKGKPIVLNFWASWCAPCQEEMPLLEKNWEQLQAQGKDIVFLGVDFQESSSDAEGFLQQHTITYPIGLDTDGSVAFKYDVTALPQTIFINRDGTVVYRVPGELTAQALSSGLQMIL
jgi:cytochrome c biogenesis protein CcmG/thiol:disulfide interchange protein DsbE